MEGGINLQPLSCLGPTPGAGLCSLSTWVGPGLKWVGKGPHTNSLGSDRARVQNKTGHFHPRNDHTWLAHAVSDTHMLSHALPVTHKHPSVSPLYPVNNKADLFELELEGGWQQQKPEHLWELLVLVGWDMAESHTHTLSPGACAAPAAGDDTHQGDHANQYRECQE